MFRASVIDEETDQEFVLISLSLDEDEFRTRLSGLGLIVGSLVSNEYRSENPVGTRFRPGEIKQRTFYRPSEEQMALMEAATLLKGDWGDRHYLLQNLSEGLRRKAGRTTGRSNLSMVDQPACFHRALELEWQWMVESPEIAKALKAFDRECGGRGKVPELSIAHGLALTLKHYGFRNRAALVSRRIAELMR